MSESDRDGNITGNLNYAFASLNSDGDYESLDENTLPFNVTFYTSMDFVDGDTLTLELNDDANEYNDIFSIRLIPYFSINSEATELKNAISCIMLAPEFLKNSDEIFNLNFSFT